MPTARSKHSAVGRYRTSLSVVAVSFWLVKEVSGGFTSTSGKIERLSRTTAPAGVGDGVGETARPPRIDSDGGDGGTEEGRTTGTLSFGVATAFKRNGNESESDRMVRSFFTPTDDGERAPFAVSEWVMERFLRRRCGSWSGSGGRTPPIDDGDSDGETGSGTASEGCSPPFYRPLLHRTAPTMTNARGEDEGGSDENESTYVDLFAPLFGSAAAPPTPGSDADHRSSGSKTVGRKHRFQSFRLTVAYDGSAYCGWQIQPDNHDLPSVQQTLVDLLDPLLGRNNTAAPTADEAGGRSKWSTNTRRGTPPRNHKPIDIRVCGRTDAGVNALAQTCRVRTYRPAVTESDVLRAVNAPPPSPTSPVSLSCTDATRVDDAFHPTFDARHRAYVYLLDAEEDGPLRSLLDGVGGAGDRPPPSIRRFASMLDETLREAEGAALDYFPLSYGKVKTETTECTLLRARVSLVVTCGGERCGDGGDGGVAPDRRRALCFEIVGDRFLRRMVRILVATAVREVVDCIASGGDGSRWEEEKGRLLCLVKAGRREESARAAPSDGLFFVGARFGS